MTHIPQRGQLWDTSLGVLSQGCRAPLKEVRAPLKVWGGDKAGLELILIGLFLSLSRSLSLFLSLSI